VRLHLETPSPIYLYLKTTPCCEERHPRGVL
jgi:hypothetical protein